MSKKKKEKKPAKKAAKKPAKKEKPKKKTGAAEHQLSDIDGVGPSLQKKLKKAGITTVEQLSSAETDELASKVDGLGETSAEKFIAAAEKLVARHEKKREKKKKEAKTKKKAEPKKKLKKKPAKKKKKVEAKAKKKKAPKKKKAAKKVEDAHLDELGLELISDDEQVVFGAIGRLGMLDDPRATEHLITCLKDSRYMVRMLAAAELGESQDKKAIDPLIETLKDDSVFVRQTAAGALENIGGSKALKAIKNAESEGLLLDELPEGIKLTRRG
jgi:transcription termination factor NusA